MLPPSQHAPYGVTVYQTRSLVSHNQFRKKKRNHTPCPCTPPRTCCRVRCFSFRAFRTDCSFFLSASSDLFQASSSLLGPLLAAEAAGLGSACGCIDSGLALPPPPPENPEIFSPRGEGRGPATFSPFACSFAGLALPLGARPPDPPPSLL